MSLAYDLNKIKFATDEATFKRAVGLYENRRVTELETLGGYYSAVVLGTKPYRVTISVRNYKQGDCTCYVRQNGRLCKHMVALAIHVVMDGKLLSDKDKQFFHNAECSSRRGVLSKEELDMVKKSITESLRYIKPYRGQSRTWFANQDSLREGCNRLSAIISDLPVNKQSAEILVKLLLRLDRKLCVGGVDDSNGIVWRFMISVVEVLEKYAQIDHDCIIAFKGLAGRETCFDWEEPLVRIFNERESEEHNRRLEGD